MTADTATDTAASDATSDGTHDATSDGTHDATSDGTHDATPDTSSGTTFACGPVLKCDAATQYCAVENSPIGTKTTYACLMPDGGGAPSCHGMSIKMPGGCGCYQSPTGEVTITSCPP